MRNDSQKYVFAVSHLSLDFILFSFQIKCSSRSYQNEFFGQVLDGILTGVTCVVVVVVVVVVVGFIVVVVVVVGFIVVVVVVDVV